MCDASARSDSERRSTLFTACVKMGRQAAREGCQQCVYAGNAAGRKYGPDDRDKADFFFLLFLYSEGKVWERVLTSVRGVCWDWGERHCSKSATGGLGIAGTSQHSDHRTPAHAATGGGGEEQLTGAEAGGQRGERVQKSNGEKR